MQANFGLSQSAGSKLGNEAEVPGIPVSSFPRDPQPGFQCDSEDPSADNNELDEDEAERRRWLDWQEYVPLPRN